MAVYINGISAVTPQNTFENNDLPENLDNEACMYLQIKIPDYKKYIPAIALRRMPKSLRIFFSEIVLSKPIFSQSFSENNDCLGLLKISVVFVFIFEHCWVFVRRFLVHFIAEIMDFPFIGGRIKPNVLTQNIARNLNLKLTVKETSSVKKAWADVKDNIDKDIAVGLKLDCYYLKYFTTKIHFAGHYVAMYGYDKEFAYLVDTDQQGGKVKTTLKNLELARKRAKI